MAELRNKKQLEKVEKHMSDHKAEKQAKIWIKNQIEAQIVFKEWMSNKSRQNSASWKNS